MHYWGQALYKRYTESKSLSLSHVFIFLKLDSKHLANLLKENNIYLNTPGGFSVLFFSCILVWKLVVNQSFFFFFGRIASNSKEMTPQSLALLSSPISLKSQKSKCKYQCHVRSVSCHRWTSSQFQQYSLSRPSTLHLLHKSWPLIAIWTTNKLDTLWVGSVL